MSPRFAFGLIAVICYPVGTVYPYEVGTHGEMSSRALSVSVIATDSSVLKDLGLNGLSANEKFPDATGRNIDQLFRDGARFEDNFPRPRHHFYDPINNRPLTIGGSAVGRTSPDWALEDKGQITGVFGIGAQEFSFSDARGYLLKALTQPTKVGRDRNFGLTFQTLGQVIHHIQDMAAPQHVRNDPHLDQGSLLGLNPLFNPSLYEKYTDRDAVRNALPFSGYAPTYSPADSTTFNTGRNFWHTPEGKGLADFTNGNFVSAGTNFDKPGLFPSPVRDESKTIDMNIQQLCTNANPPCPNSNLTGVITFYGNLVEDRYTGQTVNNPFASSLSIFDADLQKTTGTPLSQPRLFTLNRFNFALAHGFLVPRAVAYSAGLINYFFRGKLDAESQGPGTLLVKNLSTEAMQGEFGLYYDDAQGNRHPVAVTVCRVGGVDVPVDKGKCKDATLASVTISPNSRLEVSFTPPADPAPKTASEYMLVFDGNMGAELKDEAKGVRGAVAAKSITGGGSISIVLNAALIPGIDAAMLDPGHSDFGLVLPKDVTNLPASFKAGAITNGQYRGMIANHAFRAQHPTEYAAVETYLTPSAFNAEPAVFRYFPELDGGTFLIKGIGADELGNDIFTLAWLDKANVNVGANLGVTIASGVLLTFGADSSLTFLSEPQGGAVGPDSTVGVVRVFYERGPSIGGNTQVGTRDMEVLEYRKGAAPSVKIDYPLPANAFGLGGEVTSFTEAGGFTARTGSDYYLAGAHIRWTIRLDTNGFLQEDISRSGVLFLVDSLGATLFSDDVPHVAVPGAQNSVSANGVKVRKSGAGIVGYTVPYTLASQFARTYELHQRTHLGSEFVTQNTGGFFELRETQMAISTSGKPALAFQMPFGAGTQTIVKVWGADTHVLAGGNNAACAWTPDGRYFFVGVGNTLYVFSAAGVLLYTETSAFGLSPASGFFVQGGSSVSETGAVTGRYKIVTIGNLRVREIPIVTVEKSGDQFSLTLGTHTLSPSAEIAVFDSRVDDTRRPYD